MESGEESEMQSPGDAPFEQEQVDPDSAGSTTTTMLRLYGGKPMTKATRMLTIIELRVATDEGWRRQRCIYWALSTFSAGSP